MGLYLEPPAPNGRLAWANKHLAETHVLPRHWEDIPSGEVLVIFIGFPHQPLWVIHDHKELERVWHQMWADPSWDRYTIWFFATEQQVQDHCPGYQAPKATT